jgi:hypothetical protein
MCERGVRNIYECTVRMHEGGFVNALSNATTARACAFALEHTSENKGVITAHTHVHGAQFALSEEGEFERSHHVPAD